MIHYCTVHANDNSLGKGTVFHGEYSRKCAYRHIANITEMKSAYIMIKYTVQLDNMGVLPAVATLLDPPPPLPTVPHSHPFLLSPIHTNPHLPLFLLSLSLMIPTTYLWARDGTHQPMHLLSHHYRDSVLHTLISLNIVIIHFTCSFL